MAMYTGEFNLYIIHPVGEWSASKSSFLTLLGLGLGLATQANSLKIKGNCEITVHNPVYVLRLLPA